MKHHLYLVNDFQNDLETHALQIYGEEDRFRGNRIKIAPLQISRDSRNFEKMQQMGRFHHRKDIVQLYSENTHKIICRSELFIEAQRQAEETSQNCCTLEAKANHILRYGNLLFIAGQAGIGKSTFAKLLAKEIVDPKIRLFKADYVFFIRFRDVNYKDKMDLLSFLTTSASFEAKIESNDRQKILRKLEKNEQVYIIMDGLDEASIELEKDHPTCNITSITTAEVFIKNLLSGTILPHAKKLVTSRPRLLVCLPAEGSTSNFLVNILGLDDNGQKQICDNLCESDTKQRDKILEYIHSRPDLKSYCYVPINCILIMMSFNTLDSSKWDGIDSLSALLITALEDWFLKKLKGKFQTKNISRLAREGFLTDRYYFKENHLNMAGVNFQNAITFLTNKVCFKLLKGSKISYFCHLIWQEFFVAVELMLFTDKEGFKKYIPELDKDKYEMVTKFLFGLCNPDKLDDLLSLMESEGLNSEEDRRECRKVLKEIAIKILENCRDGQFRKDDYMRSVMPVLGWVYEMKDFDLTQQASLRLKDNIVVCGQILSNDIPSLNYVLKQRKSELSLEVARPRFLGNSFQTFADIVDTLINQHDHFQVRIIGTLLVVSVFF